MSVKEIKEGDRLYEFVGKTLIPIVALEDAYVAEGGDEPLWTCPVLNENTNERYELSSREGYSHYGPTLKKRN